MNIANLMGQYSQSASAKTEKLTGKKGVENLASSIKSLTKGNVFEGTVNSVKNGKVTLALSNGTQISARLDGKISLTVGQSMFFQVKSNEGSQIAIRPYMADGSGVNLTLMQALSAAGLPAESNYLAMVNKMMEEQMPIDRVSLQQMSRLVNTNSGIDVQTIVQMHKLGIPITMENAIQFENYLGDKQAITDAFDELINTLPEAMQGSELSEEGLREMNSQVLAIVTEGLTSGENAAGTADNLLLLAAEQTAAEEAGQLAGTEPESGTADAAKQLEGTAGQPVQAEGQQVETAGQSVQAEGQQAGQSVQAEGQQPGQPVQAEGQQAGQPVQAEGQQPEQPVQMSGQPDTASAEGAAAAEQGKLAANTQQPGQAAQGQPADAAAPPDGGARQTADTARMEGVEITIEAETAPAPKEHTLGAVLDSAQLANLNEQLGRLVGQQSVGYLPTKEVAALLDDQQQLLKSGVPIARDGLQRLLASEPFKNLVKDALEQQWTVKPEKLSGSDQINKLYEKQNSQMNRMADVLKATGQESASFARMVSDIRGNVDFMNQINQAYSYVQIPLKMSGQNASGELYVYTNKKALADGGKDLTAFLHLDMENLGSTDVSVRMRGREVSTNFYLENDAAYDLLERHLPILEERLRNKGYNCKISVKNEAKHVNFVEDFLKKDQPSAGQLHRYSFDMRA